MKRNICVVTSSRADYGLLCWVMKKIERCPDLKLLPVVTGTHLSKKFGYTKSEIVRDGFRNLVEIKITDDTSPQGIAQASAELVAKFSKYFKQQKIDLLVLLGDRFEMLAIALAALPFNLPIAHIGGGEITEGVIDNNVRHALTKLSHLHFVITPTCGRRIVQLGEEPWRVKVVGSPRLDSKNNINLLSKQALAKKLGLSFVGKVGLVVYHPATLEINKTKTHVNNLLSALEAVDMEIIMFYPNLDTSSDVIIKAIEAFAKNNKKVRLTKPLPRDDYFSVLNAVDILIGNSSIGIVEAPSFKLPAVNIGQRQQGRDYVGNIINVDNSTGSIIRGIKKGLYDKGFLKSVRQVTNPYGDGQASKKLVKIIRGIDFDNFKIIKNDRLR